MLYSAHQQFLNAIAGPNRALILVTAGMLGICLEFLRPGVVIPGVCGTVLLILGLHSLAALPVTAAGFVLSAIGVCLFALEGKFHRRWVCAGGGAAAMLAGLLTPTAPGAPGVQPGLALMVTVVFALVSVILLPVAYRARRNKRGQCRVNDKERQSRYAMGRQS